MAGCETMVCQAGTEERSLSQEDFRKESAGDMPTTLQPEDPTSIPVSTSINQMHVLQDESVGKKQESILPAGGEADMKKDPLVPTPVKLVRYILAALFCGMAIELGVEKAWEQNTCSAMSQERNDLSSKVDSLSDELSDRMYHMSSLLARETSENTRLREELEHAKRALKYYQGTTEMPEDHIVLKGHSTHEKPEMRKWVNEVYDDSVYQVWKVRYLISEGLRYIRVRLPAEMQLSKKLHEWEDAVVGPME